MRGGDKGDRRPRQGVSGTLLGCPGQGVSGICLCADVNAISLQKLEVWLMQLFGYISCKLLYSQSMMIEYLQNLKLLKPFIAVDAYNSLKMKCDMDMLAFLQFITYNIEKILTYLHILPDQINLLSFLSNDNLSTWSGSILTFYDLFVTCYFNISTSTEFLSLTFFFNYVFKLKYSTYKKSTQNIKWSLIKYLVNQIFNTHLRNTISPTSLWEFLLMPQRYTRLCASQKCMSISSLLHPFHMVFSRIASLLWFGFSVFNN